MKGLGLEEFNQDYASVCADFWCNSKACHLNQCKQKEYAKLKSNKRKREKTDYNELKVKVAHVLVKKSVEYNVRVMFHHFYTSKLFDSGFDTISKNISNVFHSRVFVEFFI